MVEIIYMKKFGIILLLTTITIGTSLWIKGRDVREIKTEIEIAAAPEKVWGTLTDINGWNKWNSTVNTISGEASMGSKLDITMISKEGKGGKDGPKYSPKFTSLDPQKSFRWTATMMAGFLFTNDKHITLEKTATGTKLVHKELFSGLMVTMMWSQMEKGVPPMLNTFNEALKKEVESN
jgi:hypothetical protein